MNFSLVSIAIAVCIALGLYPLHLVVVLVHELGHLLAGKICGMICHQFRVGPFLHEHTAGWSFRWSWRNCSSGAVQSVFPCFPVSFPALRAATMIIAGPLASLTLAGMGLYLALPQTRFAIVAVVLLIDSFLVASITLAPSRNSDHTTDGYKLLSLLFSAKRRRGLLMAWTFFARIEALKQSAKANDYPQLMRICKELRAETPFLPALLASQTWNHMLTRIENCARQHIPETAPADSEIPAIPL